MDLGLDEVEVVTATVDLSDVRSRRANFIARSFQASWTPKVPRLSVHPFRLCDARPLALTQKRTERIPSSKTQTNLSRLFKTQMRQRRQM